MARTREYNLKDIEFKGNGYKRDKRKVLNHKTCGVITLPVWMIGKLFDVILIPHEEQPTNEEKSN